MDSKNKHSGPDSSFSTSNKIHEETGDCENTGLNNIKEAESNEDGIDKRNPCNDASRPVPQECDGIDSESNLSETKQCSKCYLRHTQLICPVLHPLYVSIAVLKLILCFKNKVFLFYT